MTQRQLIVCIPKAYMLDYPERSAIENGDTPDMYQFVPCPDCSEDMWLGPRTKALMDSGIQATCGYCAILKHGVRSFDNITVLTKEQA